MAQQHTGAFSKGEFVIKPGLMMRAVSRVFCIIDIIDNIATLEDVDTRQRKTTPVSELLSAFMRGQVEILEQDETLKNTTIAITDDERRSISRLPLQDLTDCQKNHVIRALRYINGLRSRGFKSCNPHSPLIELELSKIATQYNDNAPPSVSSVYRWSLKFDKAHGDARVLIPRHDLRGGPTKGRIPQEIENAIAKAIDEYKSDATAMVRTESVRSTARDYVIKEYPNRPDLSLYVTWPTVDRRVKQAFSPYERCVRNKGKLAADKEYRAWYPRERAEFPLEVFETDDTDSGVFLIDGRSGLPYGRPYLTGVIDQDSEILMGWDLSPHARSVVSALSAIVCAISPKDHKSPDFLQCSYPPEVYGMPGIIIFDNALYNHAKDIELAAADISFMPGWAKPKTPTEKSTEEGWFGILKREFLSTLPGYRGSKAEHTGLAEGLKAASLELQSFRQLFLKWAYDDYANTPKKRDGLTPRQRWHQGMRLTTPRLPLDIHRLRLAACLQYQTRILPEGTRFMGIIYTTPVLEVMRRKYGAGAELHCKYNPHDLGIIYVFFPDNKSYLPAPAVHQEYAAGLTLYQHKLIRKMTRELGSHNPAIPLLMQCREELRKLTQQLRHSTKLRDRKRAVRTGDIPISGNAPEATATQDSEVTELEYQISEIDVIPLDYAAEGWVIPDDF